MSTVLLTRQPVPPTRAAEPPVADTITLHVLPPAPPRWYGGLMRPARVHLLETRDGRARIIDFGGHRAGVGVCGVPLGGGPVSPADPCLELCPSCQASFAEIHPAGRGDLR